MVALVLLSLIVLGVRAVAGGPEADRRSADPAVTGGPGPLTPAPSKPVEPGMTTPSPERAEPQPSPTTAKKRAAEVTVPANGPGTYVRSRQTADAASSRGILRRFDVQVELGLDIDADQAARLISEVLNDQRSWGGTGRWRFALAPAGQQADLHAYVVTPGTTDRLCAPLLTRGEVSCQNGNRVVLNAERWVFGVPDYDGDLANYRRYLVNHEFGHSIGHRHVPCPESGRAAPVMMQQTKGLDGCRKNPWPRADER